MPPKSRPNDKHLLTTLVDFTLSSVILMKAFKIIISNVISLIIITLMLTVSHQANNPTLTFLHKVLFLPRLQHGICIKPVASVCRRSTDTSPANKTSPSRSCDTSRCLSVCDCQRNVEKLNRVRERERERCEDLDRSGQVL